MVMQDKTLELFMEISRTGLYTYFIFLHLRNSNEHSIDKKKYEEL